MGAEILGGVGREGLESCCSDNVEKVSHIWGKSILSKETANARALRQEEEISRSEAMGVGSCKVI